MIYQVFSNKLIMLTTISFLLFSFAYAHGDPIHDTAKTGNLGELNRLIGAGVDVNAKIKGGWTPLILAAGNGQIEAVRLLLQAGADANAETEGEKYTALIIALVRGYAQAVKLLIEAGADVNAQLQDEWGYTALMFASEKGDEELVKILIEAGANIDARDKRSGTALIKASQKGELSVAKLLIAAGADVGAKENTGGTALMIASQYGHPEVARLLIEAKADIDAQSDGGVTALMLAAYHGRTEVAKLLIEQGAKVDARTPRGYKAMLYAVQRGHPEVVDLLEKARPPYAIKQAEQIPKGVTYIKTTDEKNQSTKDHLLDLFHNADSSKTLPKAAACGPFLWQELTEIMDFDKSVGIPMIFKIPTASGTQELEGRVIRLEEQTNRLQLVLKAILQDSKRFNIRKLAENEIQFYWSMISWEITEPVFMIESPGFLLLVDVETDAFFVENLYRPLRY
jgi:ankyrin repeat protein